MGKGFGIGIGKWGRKGPPIVWDGPLGPESFPEAVYEFPVKSKSDFSDDSSLRGYDPCKEDWPKCVHGEDYLVQMCAEGTDGGRCFFKCPRAWVILSSTSLLIWFCYFVYVTQIFRCSLPLLQRTAGLLCGSIRLQFIRIRSTFTTCRIVSSI